MHRNADNPYGFVESCFGDCSPDSEAQLPLAWDISWFTTGMVPHARNHCAAVMTANLLLYAQRLHGTADAVSLEQIHGRVGDGPILLAPKYAEQCLAEHGFAVRRRTLCTRTQIAAALTGGQPCAFLLCASPRHWHWILAVGFHQRPHELCYAVIDGWHRSVRYFIKGHPSHLMWASSFSI